MNCIIIDDEETSRSILKRLISKVKKLRFIDEFSNAKEAFDYLVVNKIDLVFLDVHMPEITGFDSLHLLTAKPKVIITTSDKELAIKSFNYSCIVDYLQKPFNYVTFLRAIDKVNESLIEKDSISVEYFPQNNDLLIKVNRRNIYIKIDTISLIKTKGEEIKIFTDTLNYSIKYTLDEIIKKLPNDFFMKINQNYAININKQINIEKNNVLIGSEIIPVNDANKFKLIKKIKP